MRVALFNDTGQQDHVGCRAVADAHDRMIARAGGVVSSRRWLGQTAHLWTGDRTSSRRRMMDSVFARDVAEADAVIINAEGTIHHGAGMDLLCVAEHGIAAGKQVLVVNGVFESLPDHLDTLRACHDVTCRDARSLAYLRGSGVAARLVPDSIVEASFADEPVRSFGGRVVVTDFHPARDADVGAALMGLLVDLGSDGVYDPLHDPGRAREWRHVVADWSRADLVVTGRHHGLYLAVLAGVPCVAMPSNTWKVEGAVEALGLSGIPGALCTDPRDLRAACAAARGSREAFARARTRLLGRRPLDTLAGLGCVGSGASRGPSDGRGS